MALVLVIKRLAAFLLDDGSKRAEVLVKFCGAKRQRAWTG